MQIELSKNDAMHEGEYVPVTADSHKTIGELFEGFYELLKGEPMDDKRRQVVSELEEKVQ